MLYNLNFNSKTQLINDFMKLKGIIPRKEDFIELIRKVDVNITSDGVFLVATDGFRVCSIKFGVIENLEDDVYSVISKKLFEDTIKYLKTLKTVESVKFKAGNVVGLKVTGTDKNGESAEKWFTEPVETRLPDCIHGYIEYPKVPNSAFNFVPAPSKTIIKDCLLKVLREVKKRCKGQQMVTLKLGGQELKVGIKNKNFEFKIRATDDTSDEKIINMDFLMHALRNIKEATLEIYEKDGPIRIVTDNMEHIILPIRSNA